jgi:hypothetical protein
MMELTKDNYDDFVKRLKHHVNGEGVNDHCTSNAIFIVQSYQTIGGINLDYDPPHFWVDSDHEVELTDDELLDELREWAEAGDKHDEFNPKSDTEVTLGNEILFQKIGYHESWEYVNAHLTREAAEAFIKRKAHDYRKLRIYVDSQYWCWEFNAIVQGLISGEIGLVDLESKP